MKPSHTIVIQVVNKPGVLSRVTQVFARRSFNIDSLVVSPGMTKLFSNMTITAQGDSANLEQIINQVSKLIDVVECKEQTKSEVVCKELALIKIKCKRQEKLKIIKLIDTFSCKIVDFSDEYLMIQATGDTDKLNSLLKLLNEFNVMKTIRTGKVAMTRGLE